MGSRLRSARSPLTAHPRRPPSVEEGDTLRAGIEATALIAFLAAWLFVPAGRIAWPAAWAYLALFSGFTAAAFVLLPGELVRERAAPGGRSDRVDVLVAGTGFLGPYPGTRVAAALDAGRSGSFLPAPVRGLAFAVFVAGYGFAPWATRANPFFATFVRIQGERGHAVARSGPYAWVRHPGYAGTIVAPLALPAALGSARAFAPAVAGCVLFAIRAWIRRRARRAGGSSPAHFRPIHGGVPTLVAALVASAAGWLVESPVRAVAGPIASGATGLVVGTFAFYFARRYIEGLRGGS